MSADQMYRTNSDGTRVPVDWRDGKTYEEKLADFDKPLPGRVGRLLEGLREAQENLDFQPTSRLGKLLHRLASLGSGADERALVVLDEIPRGHDGKPIYQVSDAIALDRDTPVITQQAGLLERPVTIGREIEHVARELSAAAGKQIPWQQILTTINTVNAEVVSPNSNIVQRAATQLGVPVDMLMDVASRHGFQVGQDGKIEFDARNVREPQRDSANLAAALQGFANPEWNQYAHNISATPDGIAASGQAQQRGADPIQLG